MDGVVEVAERRRFRMEDPKGNLHVECVHQFGQIWRHLSRSIVGTILFVDDAIEVTSYTARILLVQEQLRDYMGRIFLSVSF